MKRLLACDCLTWMVVSRNGYQSESFLYGLVWFRRLAEFSHSGGKFRKKEKYLECLTVTVLCMSMIQTAAFLAILCLFSFR